MKPGGTGPWRRLYLTASKNLDTDTGNTQFMLLNLFLYMFEQSFQNNVQIKIKNRMSCSYFVEL